MDIPTYQKLVARRKKEGVPNVASLLLKTAGMLGDDLLATQIVARALSRAKRKPSGARFRLRDLFPKVEWEQFPKSARIMAGGLFLEKVNAAEDGLRADGKSSSNHQYYVRS
jgi:hypothetical protein